MWEYKYPEPKHGVKSWEMSSTEYFIAECVITHLYAEGTVFSQFFSNQEY